MTENEKEIESIKDEIAQLQSKLDNLKAKKEKPSKEEVERIVQGTPSSW